MRIGVAEAYVPLEISMANAGLTSVSKPFPTIMDCAREGDSPGTARDIAAAPMRAPATSQTQALRPSPAAPDTGAAS